MLSMLSRAALRPVSAVQLVGRNSALSGACFAALARTIRTSAVALEPAKSTTEKAATKSTTKKAATKSTTKKAATKSTTTKAAPKKKTTKAAAAKSTPAKKTKAEKPVPLKLAREDYPPKQPPSPWTLFIVRYLKGADKAKDTGEAQELLKRASVTWRAFTDAETQPFKDESAALRKEWRPRYDAWLATIEPAKLKLLNEKLAARGKRTHVKRLDGVSATRVASPFARFFKERAASNNFKENSARSFMATLGKEWRSFSDEQKKPWVDAYEKEKAEYRKAHPTES